MDQSTIPNATKAWDFLTLELYATFWGHVLQDIEVPSKVTPLIMLTHNAHAHAYNHRYLTYAPLSVSLSSSTPKDSRT